MTELQMGLIGLGATAVVGVLAYNKWQEYRHRKLAEAVLRPQHDDVLLGDGPKTPPAARPQPSSVLRTSQVMTVPENFRDRQVRSATHENSPPR